MGQAVPKDDLPNEVPEYDLPEPTMGQKVLAGALRGSVAGPMGILFKGTEPIAEKAKELYEKTAYEAGGRVTDFASRKGLSPEAAGAAGFATNVGIQSLPVIGTTVGSTAAPLLKSAGRKLMQSAVKPPLSMRRSGQAGEAIETMLEKGIPPTSKGLDIAKGAVDDLEVEIQSVLERSQGLARKSTVGDSIKSAFDSVKHNLNRAQNEKDIDAALKDFFMHPEIKRYQDRFPVAIANRMKQAFYKELGERAYIPGAEASAYDKAEKALAAGLRQEVLRAEPAVRPNLEEQAKMMQVVGLLKERVGAAENQNVVGLGGAISPSISRFLIFWADRYPWFKGWLARTLYTGATPITATAGAGAGILAAEQAGESIERRTK